MGRRHIQVVRDLGLELSGVCDQNPDSLAAAAAEHRLPATQLYADVHSLLRETVPDCVIVATTAPTHCKYTCLAAESGATHILCEKPMATSLSECDRMIEACARYGTALAINHQMQFMEQYTIPKQIVRSEAFGGLASITVVAGNFGMAMNGTHYFEMFRFMTDEDPSEATAWFSSSSVANPRGTQFEDRAGAVRLVTSSGKRFYLETGDDQGHGLRVIYAGRFGQVTVDELSGRLTQVMRKEEHRPLPTTRYGMPASETVREIAPADAVAPSRSVLQALLNGSIPDSAANARLAVSALVAAYVSHETGHRAIAIKDSVLPLDRVFPWA